MDTSGCGLTNWEVALKEAEQIISSFRLRNELISGKATLINIFVESKFIYPIQTFDPPVDVFQKSFFLVRPFILKHSMHGIRNDAICLPKSLGGTGMHNLRIKHKSCRMKFIASFLKAPFSSEMMLGPDPGFPHCQELPTFYVEF